jgi:U4/U6.U5 tri-snRNP-associated protein 2
MKRGREWELTENETKVDVHAEECADITANGRPKCPYLDTVNRQVLDFDSEKLCSQTLTNRNVYVCLICGKYFEGRGKNTPAYTHSLQLNHYVFMNLESGRSYCLPDSYEIIDSSLDDIRKCLHPDYQVSEVAKLDQNTALSRDIHGVSYLPGFIGLNNLNRTDDINVVLHLLSHISPFRDFFLQTSLYDLSTSKVVKEMGMVSHFSLHFVC